MSYDNRCICGAPYAEAKHRQPCPLFLPEVDPQLRHPINGKRLREEVEELLGQGNLDLPRGGEELRVPRGLGGRSLHGTRPARPSGGCEAVISPRPTPQER